MPIPLFGAGLVEAIADETLRDLEDPVDRNGDGVSGRAAIVIDIAAPASAASAASGGRRSTRRCWRSAPTRTATRWASPTTSSRTKSAFGVSADRMRLCDPIPDPEDIADPRTRRRGIDNFASFMRFLAPVAREDVTTQTQRWRAGLRSASAARRATCPSLTTGPSANPLFNRKTVPLFSDLLLHDVGTGDGIQQASAEPQRDPHAGAVGPAVPPPAAARRLRRDHRARPMRRHAREAELARRGFERLSDADKAALLAFLKSL